MFGGCLLIAFVMAQHRRVHNLYNRIYVSRVLRKTGELLYRAADKSLARPGRKQATATEDFDVYISYL